MSDAREYVIAGNYREYRNWMRENQIPISRGVYVSDSYKLRGVHNVSIHFVGTWYYRKDAHEIETLARLVNV